jgi:hypothetical protein
MFPELKSVGETVVQSEWKYVNLNLGQEELWQSVTHDPDCACFKYKNPSAIIRIVTGIPPPKSGLFFKYRNLLAMIRIVI